MNFAQENLLLDAEDAIKRLSHMLSLLQSHIEAEASIQELQHWYEMTENLFDAIFEKGGRDYFEDNAGFVFSYWVDRPKTLESVNASRAEAIMKKVIRELQKISAKPNKLIADTVTISAANTEVFVVHGHSETHISVVARTIETLGLKTIILREQPNKGFTIIEKFEQHSEVGFAVILMTDDDLGGVKLPNEGEVQLHPRARQNVILEMGYFIGKLGRSRVCVLKSPLVEQPSDILGVVYTELDDRGYWKFELVKELKAAGYNVSADAVV